MGLDMYLNMKVSHYPKKGDTTINLANLDSSWDNLDFNEFGASNRVDISMGVGYWRKANHIHNWFVNNVQEGADNCGDYNVTMDNFNSLYDTCMNILNKLNGKIFSINNEYREDCELYVKEHGIELEETVTFDVTKLKEFYGDNNLQMYYRTLNSDDVEIEELYDYCDDNLPCLDGCFFGSQSFGWWYFHDIIKTVLLIDKVREISKQYEEKKMYVDFSYSSSW